MTSWFILAMVMALASLPVRAAVAPEGQAPGPSMPIPVEKSGNSDHSPPIVGSRGRMLYENHCTHCHVSVVHVRENRRVVSLRVLEGWVRRWSREEKLPWGEEEIAEVVDYLNQRFYKFLPSGGRK